MNFQPESPIVGYIVVDKHGKTVGWKGQRMFTRKYDAVNHANRWKEESSRIVPLIFEVRYDSMIIDNPVDY